MRPVPDRPAAGQESVWDYPRPAVAQPTGSRIVIEHHGQVVADTRNAVRTLETSHPPSYYIPPADIAPGLLRRAAGSSFCEWKGAASYWDVELDGLVLPRVGWATRRRRPPSPSCAITSPSTRRRSTAAAWTARR